MKGLMTLILFIFVNHGCCEFSDYVKDVTVVRSCDNIRLPDEVQFITDNKVCAEGPCIVRPGTNIVLNITFTSPRYLENIKHRIVASAIGVTLDWPLIPDNACSGILNTPCPLVKGEIVKYSHIMYLADIFPEATVGLRFSVDDKDESNSVICFQIDIQLKKN